MYKKVTTGFVIQTFGDDGQCTQQEFVASDDVKYEDEDGSPIDHPDNEQYQPLNMENP